MGFTEEAAVYRKLLEDAEKPDIVASGPNARKAAAARVSNSSVPSAADLLGPNRNAANKRTVSNTRNPKTKLLVGKNGPATPRSNRDRNNSTSSVKSSKNAGAGAEEEKKQ